MNHKIQQDMRGRRRELHYTTIQGNHKSRTAGRHEQFETVTVLLSKLQTFKTFLFYIIFLKIYPNLSMINIIFSIEKSITILI